MWGGKNIKKALFPPKMPHHQKCKKKGRFKTNVENANDAVRTYPTERAL